MLLTTPGKIDSIKIQKIAFLTLGIALSVIVIYRAATLSFTHDESGSYLFFHNNTIWELFTDKEVWYSANNHIINTILYQISIGLFGHSDFTMRLPNVLAFISGYTLCYVFMFRYFTSVWGRIAIVAILFANPYVIDFYSLCRGYGLGMFFSFAALVFIYKYLQNEKSTQLAIAYLSISLASLSLLSNLIFLPVFTLALWIILRKELLKKKEILWIPSLFTLGTLLLVAKPIYTLSGNNELKYGLHSIWESFKGFINGSIRFHNYLGKETSFIFTILFIIALLLAVYFSFKKQRNVFYAVSFIILIITLHFTYYAFDFYFPSERKTTLYVPLLAFLFAGLLRTAQLNKSLTIIAGLLIAFWSIHFVKTISYKDTIEWYYDGGTKNRILSLPTDKEITLKAHWNFHPTLEYYTQTKKLSNIYLLPYDKNFNMDLKPDYVIGFTDEMKKYSNYKSTEPNEAIALFYKIK